MASEVLENAGAPTRARIHGRRPGPASTDPSLGATRGGVDTWAALGLWGKLRHGGLWAPPSTLPGGLACVDFPLNCKKMAKNGKKWPFLAETWQEPSFQALKQLSQEEGAGRPLSPSLGHGGCPPPSAPPPAQGRFGVIFCTSKAGETASPGPNVALRTGHQFTQAAKEGTWGSGVGGEWFLAPRVLNISWEIPAWSSEILVLFPKSVGFMAWPSPFPPTDVPTGWPCTHGRSWGGGGNKKPELKTGVPVAADGSRENPTGSIRSAPRWCGLRGRRLWEFGMLWIRSRETSSCSQPKQEGKEGVGGGGGFLHFLGRFWQRSACGHNQELENGACSPKSPKILVLPCLWVVRCGAGPLAWDISRCHMGICKEKHFFGGRSFWSVPGLAAWVPSQPCPARDAVPAGEIPVQQRLSQVYAPSLGCKRCTWPPRSRGNLSLPPAPGCGRRRGRAGIPPPPKSPNPGQQRACAAATALIIAVARRVRGR